MTFLIIEIRLEEANRGRRVSLRLHRFLGQRVRERAIGGSGMGSRLRHLTFARLDSARRNNGLNQYLSWENMYPNPPQHWGSAIYYDDNFQYPSPPWIPPGNGVTMADGYITASYNALNQPVAMWSFAYSGTPNLMFFGVDPLGRCVKRWVSSSGDPTTPFATFLYYDSESLREQGGWNLIQEGTGASAASAQRLYIHGGRVDEIVKSINYGTGQSAFHHYDARGHCTLLTDVSGNVLEQYDYDAFGFPYFYDRWGNSLRFYDTASSWRGYSPYGNRFLFTGREWLSDLKLYDFRNRMYQPELGRFLQPDPKEFTAGDYNLYRYCHNDPVNKTDPMGLVPPGEGLLDVPKKMLEDMFKASQQNVENTATKPAYDPNGKPVKQEFRTTNFTNGSKEQTASEKGGYHPRGSMPTTRLPKDPFKGAGRATWDTHSHISSDGRPYGNDKTAADILRVPLGVQSATEGPVMHLYVPSTRGGGGGEFWTPDGKQLFDYNNHAVPH
jgi:RHS repeat-associated protein